MNISTTVGPAVGQVERTGWRVFVISLKSAQNRRREFAQHADLSNANWEFFDACETLSPALTYSDRRSMIEIGRTLHPRELACYSSHYSVWQKIAAENIQQALILEDDTRIDWSFVEKIMGEDLSRGGIDYLKLYNMRAVPFRIVKEPYYRRSLIRFSGYAFGMQAYILTAAGAAKLVDSLKVATRPVDDAIDRDWIHGLPNLAVFPYPVFEVTGPSTIGEDRYGSPPLPRDLVIPRFRARVREKLSRLFLASHRRRLNVSKTVMKQQDRL